MIVKSPSGCITNTLNFFKNSTMKHSLLDAADFIFRTNFVKTKAIVSIRKGSCGICWVNNLDLFSNLLLLTNFYYMIYEFECTTKLWALTALSSVRIHVTVLRKMTSFLNTFSDFSKNDKVKVHSFLSKSSL